MVRVDKEADFVKVGVSTGIVCYQQAMIFYFFYYIYVFDKTSIVNYHDAHAIFMRMCRNHTSVDICPFNHIIISLDDTISTNLSSAYSV